MKEVKTGFKKAPQWLGGDDCLLHLTADECQKLSNFIEAWKYDEGEEVRNFVEKVQTTLQYFF